MTRSMREMRHAAYDTLRDIIIQFTFICRASRSAVDVLPLFESSMACTADVMCRRRRALFMSPLRPPSRRHIYATLSRRLHIRHY